MSICLIFFLSISLKTVLVKCPCSFCVESTEINKKSLKIPNRWSESYIEEEHTTQWQKEKVQKDKQWSTKKFKKKKQTNIFE
jgi:hypothetical protein